MYDLFEKIKRGSIMLWKVDEESDLPKRKEMIRLLGTDAFTYYKSHGHHRDYIRTLSRLCLYLSSNALQERAGYWAQLEMSHFLFTENEIESNAFFLLKYSDKCRGTYYVDKDALRDLEKLIRQYEQVRSITDEIKSWSSRIQDHKDEIASDGINDRIISDFAIVNFENLMDGYGMQAIDHARDKLQAWHDLHFWKSKQPIAQAENADLADSTSKIV